MADTQTWENFLSVTDVAGMADVSSKASIAIQSQYSSSKRIKALAELFHEYVDQNETVKEVLSNIANPSTAVGVFLDWWGKRVGVPRYIEINGKNTRLDDDYYRFLIFYKAIANISDSSIQTMNNLLTMLIGLPVFVIDNQDMTISVRILGQPTDLQIVIIQNYGLLTRAAGVGYNIIIQNPETLIFGFLGSELQPFNQGVFNPVQEIRPIAETE